MKNITPTSLRQPRTVMSADALAVMNLTSPYKNILIVFTEESMRRFFDWIVSFSSSPANYHQLPHGRNRIYSSPHSNMYLVYSDCELDELTRS